jgi:hypothetical protein
MDSNPNINRNIINSNSKASNNYACTTIVDMSALGTEMEQKL